MVYYDEIHINNPHKFVYIWSRASEKNTEKKLRGW
jgi:hypothetical protein